MIKNQIVQVFCHFIESNHRIISTSLWAVNDDKLIKKRSFSYSELSSGNRVFKSRDFYDFRQHAYKKNNNNNYITFDYFLFTIKYSLSTINLMSNCRAFSPSQTTNLIPHKTIILSFFLIGARYWR